MKFIPYSERVLLTLWIGGMWSIGYIAFPTLFAVLDDRQLAGHLAGEMFQIIAYIGLVCGSLLLLSNLVNSKRTSKNTAAGKNWRLWILITMLILVAIGLFYLQPLMQDLKSQGIAQGSEQLSQFRRLHGISAVLHMINSVLGLVLVAFGLSKNSETQLAH